MSIVLRDWSLPSQSLDPLLVLAAPLNIGESLKFVPLVGELGNLFASTEKFVGGSMVVASSCWQPNIELSRLACDAFLLERMGSPFDYAAS